MSSMEPPSKLHQLDYMREPTSLDTGAFKTSMKPTSNLHGTSIRPASASVDTGAFKTSMKPTSNLHGTSIKPASVRLHERTSRCRYRGRPSKPPWNFHQNCIKNVQKVVMQMDVKSIANRSLFDRKINSKNVIACVHFDVVFSGQ